MAIPKKWKMAFLIWFGFAFLVKWRESDRLTPKTLVILNVLLYINMVLYPLNNIGHSFQNRGKEGTPSSHQSYDKWRFL
jgi:hypothetical protein